MEKEYTILQLNECTVNIEIKTKIVIEDTEYVLKTEGKAYSNSEYGRQLVRDELPQNIVNAIFSVWGDTPNVEDPPKPIIYNED